MIRPLDLQTLYMNLDKVGKEAAQSRDNVHNQQLAGAQKFTKDHDVQRHTVGKTAAGSEASEGGSEKVKADGRNNSGGQRRGHAPPAEPETPEADPEDPGFTDPELGRHIDFSG